MEATSTEVSPVTHTALVKINKESTHEIPFIVQRGSINRPVPIRIIIKKLPARIKEGFVLRPNNLTKPLDRLKKEFSDEYVVLLRMHYWIVDQLDLSKYPGFVYNGSDYDDITELYMISDICMTDYSSVFFDYANLKRPILYYMYDLEKYRDVLRGFYLDIEKELPGPILQTNDEVIDAIKNIDKVNEEYKDKYQEFYNRFCCIDDGNAAKRVCEKVFGVK